jgi:hypothetical protein
MLDYAKEKGDVTVHTPALFIYMNLELLELIDDRRFTAERYREAVARHDRLREVIKHDTERRHKAGL